MQNNAQKLGAAGSMLVLENSVHNLEQNVPALASFSSHLVP